MHDGPPVRMSGRRRIREEPGPPDPIELRTRAEAEAYVAAVCFTHSPPRLVGVELEWLLQQSGAPDISVDLDTLAKTLGSHAPTTINPRSPALPLPAGSSVTVEPGGQVELASAPVPGLGPLFETVRADTEALHRLLAAGGVLPQPRSADSLRPPVRLLDLPRYRAMERYFDRIGPAGRSGMCSTAAVQVCLDAGDGTSEVARRWAAVHAVGPVLLAAFANSPLLHGRRTGWKSSRWACWSAADISRTAPPDIRQYDADTDPAPLWARRVLDTPLLCIRRDGEWDVPNHVTFAEWIGGALPGAPPTVADLEYHITTLFPPVRPRGHLEVRYVDGQPGRGWALPTAVLVALTSTAALLDRVLEICAPVQGRWVSAARHGLADPLLAQAAHRVFELACATMPSLGAPPWVADDLMDMTERHVTRGRCPADEPLAGEEPAEAISGRRRSASTGRGPTPLQGWDARWLGWQQPPTEPGSTA